jgi:hypothetical protein
MRHGLLEAPRALHSRAYVRVATLVDLREELRPARISRGDGGSAPEKEPHAASVDKID